MKQAKENAKENVDFPIEICAICQFCHLEKTNYLCWVKEPVISGYDEDTPVFSRGIPVDPNWPMCSKFKPKMHS